MKDMSFNTRLHMLFQYDGISPHYNCQVCQWWSRNYPGSLTGNGRKAPGSWRARSASLNLFDFFFSVGIFENKGFQSYSQY